MFQYKLESFKLPQCYQGDLKAVLIPRGLITDRIKCLAQEICYAIGDKVLSSVFSSDVQPKVMRL